MPDFNDMFPSKYMKSADLKGGEFRVCVSGIQQEQVQDSPPEQRWVIYFQSTEKGMILNVTNGRMLANLFGQDTDSWIGQYVVLYAAQTQTPDGKPTLGLRIRKDITVQNSPEATAQNISVQEGPPSLPEEGDLPF